MSEVLLFGANGQLGYRLAEALGERCTALTRAEADFTTLGEKQLRAMLDSYEPKYILNAAAYTAVDTAESEQVLASHINATMPALLAAEAETRGIWLIHFSTDYVFDGQRGAPYTEASPTGPRNHYGASKLAGEQAVLAAGGTVLRLQWVYDTRGRNFFTAMRERMARGEALRVVADQWGAPGYAPHIAACVVQLMANTIPAGLYHLAAQGSTSWHGFATAFAGGVPVTPITSAEYPTPATRPLDARLDCSALARLGIAMPHWHEGIREALAQL